MGYCQFSKIFALTAGNVRGREGNCQGGEMSGGYVREKKCPGGNTLQNFAKLLKVMRKYTVE